MSCQPYDSCVAEEKQALEYPDNGNSLYSNKIYDDQIARRKCYQRNPIGITEGFGGNIDMNVLLKVIAIVLLVLLVVILLCRWNNSPGPMFGGGGDKLIDFSNVFSELD